MSRLIDAEVFGGKIESLIEWVDINLEEDRFSEGCKASLKDALSTLKYFTPTVDAVPVVRCKDCIHRDPEDFKCDCGVKERQGCIFAVADDYFCKDGERKTDENCNFNPV